MPMLVEVDAHFDQDASLPHPRTIAIAAALVIVTCVLAMLPLAAFGDAPEPTQVPTEVQQAAETRMEIDELNAQAIDDAPKAVGETCRQTLEVDGIGDSCVTRDGLLRVEQADGRSHTIHGLDAPPVGVATYAPGSQAAVDGAGIGDIACVTAPQPRYVLVYAHPANVASRYASIAPKLQSELYKVSAFIDSESQSITPGASRTVPVACDAGGPVVLNLALDGLSAGTAGFGDIVDGLRAKGLEFNGDGSNSERYIVYYDSPSPTRAAGTGHVFASDASAGATNSNNTGGLYAVEYRFDGGGSVPHWEVMIHEVLHTMGAVVSTAPNTSGLVGTVGAGHCIDGLDIMCYNDGGSRGGSYTETTCPTKVLDCNRDDYFHPSPPAGSFLATHWNVAATYNRFLISGGATRAPRALAPTASISNLRQSGASNAAVGLTWNASGGTSYVVGIRQPNGSWKDVLTTSERTATIAGLSARRSYEIGVGVSGSTDRVSVTATTTAAKDTKAPTRPGKIRVQRTATTIKFRWTRSRDNVGVAQYQVRQLTTSTGRARTKPWVRARSAGTTMTIPVRGLKTGKYHRFDVIARDAAGNVSSARTVRVLVKHVRPTRPARLRAKAKTARTVTLTWAPSRAASGIAGYKVQQRVGKRWKPLKATIRPNRRIVRVTQLRQGTTYSFRIVARGKAGKTSFASRPLRAKTR